MSRRELTFHPILDADGRVWACPCTDQDHRGRMKVDGDGAVGTPAESLALLDAFRAGAQ